MASTPPPSVNSNVWITPITPPPSVNGNVWHSTPKTPSPSFNGNGMASTPPPRPPCNGNAMVSTPPPPYNSNGGQNGGNGSASSSPFRFASPRPRQPVSGNRITPELTRQAQIDLYLNGTASHKVDVLNLHFEKPGSYTVSLNFPQGGTMPPPSVSRTINLHAYPQSR